MIRGVTFDWWHTIAETPWPDFDERMRRLRIDGIRGAFLADGVPVEDGILEGAYDRHTEFLEARWATTGDLDAEAQTTAFLEFAGVDPEDTRLRASVQEAFGQAIRAKLPILYPHIAQTLARLKREGYAVGLVSNTGRTWGRFLRPIQDEMGIGKHFDVRVFSDEVRARKPDRRMFETALEALRLPPETVVHIGDDVAADVEGARAAGLRAVWFNTGLWPGAKADRADAEIRDHEELLDVLGRWRA